MDEIKELIDQNIILEGQIKTLEKYITSCKSDIENNNRIIYSLIQRPVKCQTCNESLNQMKDT